MQSERYIWHETVQTQHTRRSFRSEIAPDVLATVTGWLGSDLIALPGGYRCVVMSRSESCLQAEVWTPHDIRLCVIGVAVRARCAVLWARLHGDAATKPAEPWCGVWLDPTGLIADPEAYHWLGDFERCLAWAFIDAQNEEPK